MRGRATIVSIVTFRRIVVRALGFTLLLAVGTGLLLRGLLPQFLYFPAPGQGATPGRPGVDYEEVWLRTEDGVSLSAWYVPGPDPSRVVLWFHGNAGNLSDRAARLRRMQAAELSVLALDYRGYGRSEGRPSPAGTALDARAAWRFLVEARGVDPRRIVLFGSSLGAAVALELAVEVEEVGLVVLESPFLSVRAMARELLPSVPGVLLPNPYDNAAAVARLSAPLLIYHGDRDAIVPFEHGRELFERAASAERLFVSIPGGGHLCLEQPGPLDSFAHFCRAATTLAVVPPEAPEATDAAQR